MSLKLGNITIRVSDLKEATAFFEEKVGLPKTYEWSNYVTFNAGGGLRFCLKPGGKRGPKESFPDLYFEVEDIDEAYDRLKGRGVTFVGEPKDQYWGGRTATFLDPDENRYTLVQLKE